MPLPLIFLLGSGIVAAASRGAAWFAERKVKEINNEIYQVESRASQKNEQYKAQREYWKHEFERRLAVAAEVYRALCETHGLNDSEVEGLTAEPWLLSRIGDLTIRRPLLIVPRFDMPAGMHEMQGYRMFQAGTNLMRSNQAMGQALQGAGAVYYAGAYVAQQTNSITEADKYIASARLYMAALEKTIDGFDSRFSSEVNDDLQSVERLTSLLTELQAGVSRVDTATAKCVAIVHRSLVSFLRGLIGRY